MLSCKTRVFLVVAIASILGCMDTGITHRNYPLTPPLAVPFFATAQKGGVNLYVGYGYSLSTFEIFAFNIEDRSFVARAQFSPKGVTRVCESSEGIVLSRLEDGPLIVSYRAGAIVMEPALAPCPVASAVIICGEGHILFHGWLPGRQEELSVCYNSYTRKTAFHITSEEGIRRDLGEGGTSPGRPGRFVVTRGVQPDTFLVHHTQSAIPESAVLIDADAGTVKPFSLPDLTRARPSRGFGAGFFGVTLHPVRGGILAEGEGGEVFLLKDGNTHLLSDNAVGQSVRIGTESCSATLVARTGAGEEFRVYDLCGH